MAKSKNNKTKKQNKPTVETVEYLEGNNDNIQDFEQFDEFQNFEESESSNEGLDNNDDPQIIDIFPIPIHKEIFPYEVEDFVEFFDKQPMVGDSLEDLSPLQKMNLRNFGDRSVNNYILNKKKSINLKNYLQKIILQYGNLLGYTNYTEYKITQSWLSSKKPDEQHQPHSHGNSLISGIFYYGDYEEDTPGISFSRPYIAGVAHTLVPDKVIDVNNRYSWDDEGIRVKTGMIILFPSSLLHSVPLNTTDSIRKSLAFNAVPKTGLGTESSLNELKF